MDDPAERLANARGETVEEVRRRFSAEEIERCPKRFSKRLPELRNAALRSTGVRDGLAFAELPDGHVFYSFVSKPKHRREYKYVADTLPSVITEETYLAAIDAVQRYATDAVWPPSFVVPSDGGNIVEVGAYLGHKTIRFAEEMAGDAGRVLAVEMIPENAEILRKNVEANGLSHKIDVVVAGVWDKAETREIFSKGRQRNAIAPIENLEEGERVSIQTKTLDQILDEWGVRPVDLVFMTVNGAEVEALRGSEPERREVRSLYIISGFKRDEGANADICRELLTKKGYALHSAGRHDRLIATLPGVAHDL